MKIKILQVILIISIAFFSMSVHAATSIENIYDNKLKAIDNQADTKVLGSYIGDFNGDSIKDLYVIVQKGEYAYEYILTYKNGNIIRLMDESFIDGYFRTGIYGLSDKNGNSLIKYVSDSDYMEELYTLVVEYVKYNNNTKSLTGYLNKGVRAGVTTYSYNEDFDLYPKNKISEAKYNNYLDPYTTEVLIAKMQEGKVLSNYTADTSSNHINTAYAQKLKTLNNVEASTICDFNSDGIKDLYVVSKDDHSTERVTLYTYKNNQVIMLSTITNTNLHYHLSINSMYIVNNKSGTSPMIKKIYFTGGTGEGIKDVIYEKYVNGNMIEYLRDHKEYFSAWEDNEKLYGESHIYTKLGSEITKAEYTNSLSTLTIGNKVYTNPNPW